MKIIDKLLTREQALLIIAIIAAVGALSGWGTAIINWSSSIPKIRGEIFTVIIGVMKDPRNPDKNLTTFNIYLYLTNRRKNTVHILDYELEVDTGSGYEKMERVWGANTIPNWTFTSQTHIIEIPDYPEKLITARAEPIEHGIPLHGFVLFATEKPQHLFIDQVKRYRITCIDAYQTRHKITTRPDQLPNIYLLQELAGMKITPK